ncbi:MAG: MMPL family transporter [Syntrophobacteraceae bacterium]|jgi:hopanoid biosynthesis associated RND transporter like protein HpnN
MNPLSRLLKLWVSLVLTRPRLVLAVAGVMAFTSIVFTAAKLEMVTDQLELIATDHPLIRLSKMLDPFRMGGTSSFAVVIQAHTPHQAVTFIDELSSRIRQDKEHFQDVIVRIDPDSFRPWQLLYLDKQDLLDLRKRVDQHYQLVQEFSEAPELLGFLKLVNREMSSRMVGELFTGFLDNKELDERTNNKEPFDLSFLIVTLEGIMSYLQDAPSFRSPWSSFFENASHDPELAGYFWEADKRFLLAFVVPNSTESGFLGTRGSLIRLRELIKDTRASFPDIQAGVTGQEALKIDEVSTVSNDMATATWLSLVGVFILMVVFFRSFRRPCLQIITLIAGLCWTFGWTTLFIGHLNILSVVFAPLLCGLGVDYGIHWLARFEEESMGDEDTQRVIARVTERSGYGIFLAALSGALCFLPLILTGFRGVVEMGLVTGMGIIFILIATFSVLPALSICMEGKSAKRLSRPVSPAPKDLFYLKPHQARFILAGAAFVSVLSIWGAGRVYFDPNPLRLQSASAESVIWEKTLLENAQHSPLFAAAFGFSPEEVRTKTKALEELASVAQVESVFSLLPKDQEEKIPILHSLSRRIPVMRPIFVQDLQDDSGEFIDVLKRIRFKMQEDQAERWGAGKPVVEQMTQVRDLAQGIIEHLRGSPDDERSLLEYRKRFAKDSVNKWDILSSGANTSTMTIQDLPEIVRNQFLHDGTYLIRIFPKESIFKAHTLGRFVNDILKVDSQVIGSPVSFYVFANALKGACTTASIYAILVIFILLMLSFRSLRLTLPVLVPLALGSIWTVGIMGCAGIQFNMANSIFMPLVVGAGVEYGIIILQRWREGNSPPGHLPFSTGKGVILAALSTTIGFGALMVSQHRGIFSLGFVAWEGSLCVLLAAVIILPAILTFMSTGKSEEVYSKESRLAPPSCTTN